MASAAVGETSNAAAAGNRRSCNQNNICSNGTISAAAVNKKSSLLLQADQQQKQLLAVQPGATAGSEKLNAAPGKSCSVNVDKNSMADRGALLLPEVEAAPAEAQQDVCPSHPRHHHGVEGTQGL